MSRGTKVEPCIYRVGPKRFRVVYRDFRGRQLEATVRGSLKDARHFRAERVIERYSLRSHDPRGERAPLLELVPEYLAEKSGLRKRTQEKIESSLRNHVLPVFGEFPIGAIRRGDIQKWVNAMSVEGGLAPETVRNHYGTLNALLRWAVVDDIIQKSPAVGIRLPPRNKRVETFLTERQVVQLAGAFPPRYRTLLLFTAYLGCRWQEVAGLRVDALTTDGKGKARVQIRRTIERARGVETLVEMTKTTYSRRDLIVPTFLSEMLKGQLERYSDGVYVFPAQRGGHMRYNNFRTRVWGPSVKDTPFSDLTFHDLRHTAAALMLKEDAGDLDLKKALGHGTIRTSQDVYGHLFEDHRYALADRLDALYRSSLQPLSAER